jgi:hypothetical protein
VMRGSTHARIESWKPADAIRMIDRRESEIVAFVRIVCYGEVPVLEKVCGQNLMTKKADKRLSMYFVEEKINSLLK